MTNVMGRPRDEFDWDLVTALAMLEAPERFVAERLITKDKEEITEKSIKAKVKVLQRRLRERFNQTYVEFREDSIDGQRIKLRQALWNSALVNKNIQAQIHMAKNYLGHADRMESRSKSESEVKAVIVSESRSESLKRIFSDERSRQLALELAEREVMLKKD